MGCSAAAFAITNQFTRKANRMPIRASPRHYGVHVDFVHNLPYSRNMPAGVQHELLFIETSGLPLDSHVAVMGSNTQARQRPYARSANGGDYGLGHSLVGDESRRR